MRLFFTGMGYLLSSRPSTLPEMLRHATSNKGRNARRYQAGGRFLFLFFLIHSPEELTQEIVTFFPTCLPFTCAVTVVVPAETAVRTPSVEMVATFGLLLDQDGVSFRLTVKVPL